MCRSSLPAIDRRSKLLKEENNMSLMREIINNFVSDAAIVDGLNGEMKNEEAVKLLYKLLHSIENLPINHREKSYLASKLEVFCRSNNISAENPITQNFTRRLSYNYLPSISKLDFVEEKVEIDELQTDIVIEENGVLVEYISKATEVPNFTDFLAPTNVKYYYTTTITRQKSTMSSIYHMTLIETCALKHIRNRTMNDSKSIVHCHPMFTFSTNSKSKYEYNIYPYTAEPRDLKDKAPVGKLIKESDNIFIGLPIIEYASSSSFCNPIILKLGTTGAEKCISVEGVMEAIGDEQDDVIMKSVKGNSFYLNVKSNSRVQEALDSASNHNSKYIYFCSKAAKRYMSRAGKVFLTYTETYKNSTRLPSRKNIIVDSCVTDDDEYDWLHNNHIPMFQLSKASEDSFDCEFYNMSPLQSFSLCMAIFLS